VEKKINICEPGDKWGDSKGDFPDAENTIAVEISQKQPHRKQSKAHQQAVHSHFLCVYDQRTIGGEKKRARICVQDFSKT